MSIRDFFHGGGIIVAENQFISLRLVKECLEKKFTIQVLEETPHRLRCKIIRFVRLYAAPIPYPNPSLEVSIQNERDEAVINYRITDYDYYILIILVLIAGISSLGLGIAKGMIGAFGQAFTFSIFVLIFFGSLIFLDARVFAFRIKKALLHSSK